MRSVGLQEHMQWLQDADYAEEADFRNPFKDDTVVMDRTGSEVAYQLAEMREMLQCQIADDLFIAIADEGDPCMNRMLGRPLAPGLPAVEPKRNDQFTARELRDVFKRVTGTCNFPSVDPAKVLRSKLDVSLLVDAPPEVAPSVNVRLQQSFTSIHAQAILTRAAARTLPMSKPSMSIPIPIVDLQRFDPDDEFVARQAATPPTMLVLGPPGCGSTTLCKMLCESYGCAYFGMQQLIEREIAAGSELGQQAQQALLDGQLVERAQLLNILKSALASPQAKHGGWVLDGFPMSDTEMSHLEMWGAAPQFIVEIELDDAEVMHRRLSLRVGSGTGNRYSEEHVAPGSFQRLAHPFVEPEPPKPKTEEEEEEPEPEEEDPDAPPKDDGPIKLADMGRLLMHPKDARSAIQTQLLTWHALRSELASQFNLWHSTRHVRISGSQEAQGIHDTVRHQLRYVQSTPIAAAIEMPEGCEADDEAFEAAADAEDVAGNPILGCVSEWGRHCPVALVQKDTAVVGKPELAVKYNSRVFLCSSQAARSQFIAAPRLFLQKRPCPKNRRVIVCGPPASGKRSVAAALAEHYGWKHISAVDLLQEEISRPAADQAAAGQNRKAGFFVQDGSQGFLKQLRSGSTIPNNKLLELLMAAADKIDPTQGGWVLDGLPLHKDSAFALVNLEGKLRPDLVVMLEAEGTEELVERASAAGWHNAAQVEASITKYTADYEAFKEVLAEVGKPPEVPEPAEGEELAEPEPSREPPIAAISCAGPLTTVIGRVRRIIDPFVLTAAACDASEAEAAPDPIEGDPTQWGEAGELCPVMLSEGKVRHGMSDFTVKFKRKFYKCSSEQTMEKFTGAPELFTGREFSLPPPRVLVMGPPESGHLTLANTLASETAAVVQDLNKTITAVDHGTVAVSNRVVLSELNRHQLASQGVVSLGLPYLRVASTINDEGEEEFEEVRDPAEQMMALLEGGVYFDAVIVVTQADELAVERLLVQPTFDELEAKRLESVEDPAEDDEKSEEDLDAEIEEWSGAISEANNAAADAIEALLAVLEEKQIPVLKLDGKNRPAKLSPLALTNLGPLLGQERNELLAKAVNPPPAGEEPGDAVKAVEESLLRCTRQLSRFGRECPVSVAEVCRVRNSIYSAPVLYKHHVYFPLGPEEAALFKKKPQSASRQNLQQQRVNVTAFVVGGPRSGRSTVAAAIAKHNRAQLVSVTEVLTRVLKSSSALRTKIEPLVRAGLQVPDQLLVEAIVRMLRSFGCIRDGWVIDGFPTRATQLPLLEAAGVIPQQVFCTEKLGLAAPVEVPPNIPLHSFEQTLSKAQDMWEVDHAAMKEFYTRGHSCWHALLATQSKFARSNEAVSTSWARACSLTKLVEAERDGNAILADQLGFSPVQQEQMLGPLLDVCPVTLAEDSKLLKAAPGIRNTVLYQGRLFKPSSAAARDKLLADPAHFLDCCTLYSGPLEGCLPVPLHSSIVVDPHDLALNGHCPVTLSFDPTSAQCVIPGSKDWQVHLGGNVYRMV